MQRYPLDPSFGENASGPSMKRRTHQQARMECMYLLMHKLAEVDAHRNKKRHPNQISILLL